MAHRFFLSGFVLVLFSLSGLCQDSIPPNPKLRLLFMGDIMGHDSQIKSARVNDSVYDYSSNFQYITPIIAQADLAIANLEVTLAGAPYKGYPQFSSPDALAVACRDAGIDVLLTANNHCVDKGKNGLLRTITMLDSLCISHTGTYRDSAEKALSPLLIEKNGIRLAIINATYGTNGISVPSPTVVDLIDTNRMKQEILLAREKGAELVLVFPHWGLEYQTTPNREQKQIASAFFSAGADMVIGSHPHVIQRSELIPTDSTRKQHFITYSLGNFISNQRKPNTDGGQMVQLDVERVNDTLIIQRPGHYLTYSYAPVVSGKKTFYILPCAQFERDTAFFADTSWFNSMNRFSVLARQNLNKNNKQVDEFFFIDGVWQKPNEAVIKEDVVGEETP